MSGVLGVPRSLLNNHFITVPISSANPVSVKNSDVHVEVGNPPVVISAFRENSSSSHYAAFSVHDHNKERAIYVDTAIARMPTAKKCCTLFSAVLLNLMILAGCSVGGYYIDKEDKYSVLWGALTAVGITTIFNCWFIYKYCRARGFFTI
jgi:hypothetical protein